MIPKIKLTNLEAKIFNVFAKKFDWNMSILELSKNIGEYYPNTYQAIKNLEKKGLLQFSPNHNSTIIL